MTYLIVLGDGTVIPQIGFEQLVLFVESGVVVVGFFDKKRYICDGKGVQEVYFGNKTHEIIIEYLLDKDRFIFFKKHRLYIICPEFVASMVRDENIQFVK